MTYYVLVDGENGQPKALESFYPSEVQLLVFAGPNQKLSPHVQELIGKLGDQARVIRSPRSGHNALDLVIAYYIGEISARDPNAEFAIISNDADFDPLIDHLRQENRTISRWIHALVPRKNKPEMLDSYIQRLIPERSPDEDIRKWWNNKTPRTLE